MKRVEQVIQLDKNYFCVRYNGDLITGTQKEIESFIRKNELDLWLASNNRFNCFNLTKGEIHGRK